MFSAWGPKSVLAASAENSCVTWARSAEVAQSCTQAS